MEVQVQQWTVKLRYGETEEPRKREESVGHTRGSGGGRGFGVTGNVVEATAYRLAAPHGFIERLPPIGAGWGEARRWAGWQ